MSKNLELESFVQARIFYFRGFKVMLDKDLAGLYGVKPFHLREQVKRNKERFPKDFTFRLNKKEMELMVSQNAIPSMKYFGGHEPYVFTEQGVAMLSSVLHSDRAIAVNVQIMRTFVKLREFMISHKELAKKIEKMEMKFKAIDQNFIIVFEAIRKLLEEPQPKKTKIGFHTE